MARIPLRHPRTLFVRFCEWGSRKKYGEVLDPGLAVLHNRRVLTTMLLTEATVSRWRSLDPTLKALATMVAAGEIACSWCMDFGHWEYTHQGIDPAKLRDVPRWRDSGCYTDVERQVMAYAEAMTATPPAVTDAMVAELQRSLTHEQLVELTAMVALENQRSRTNAALGLRSQRFRDTCELRPA